MASLERSMDPRYRILVCGSIAVGKTMLVRNFVASENPGSFNNPDFNSKYRPTICLDINFRCMYPSTTAVGATTSARTVPVNIQIYDLAGMMRDNISLVAYLNLVSAAIIVVDMTRFTDTWQEMDAWNARIDRYCAQNELAFYPKLLLCNKCDLTQPTPEQQAYISQFCIDHGFCGWFETSARTKQNLYEAFDHLVRVLEQYYSTTAAESRMESVSLISPRSSLPHGVAAAESEQGGGKKAGRVKQKWDDVRAGVVNLLHGTARAPAGARQSWIVPLDRRCDC
jgi:small GTP-binding protein